MIKDAVYKVGIYLRLSREDEKLGESGSISTQRDLLMEYIQDNGLLFVDEYVDDGVSGTTFDRKGFLRMIRDCEEKKINMIITKDTSRLGRDHIEFGYYVEKFFPEHHIRYVAVVDGVDTFCNSVSNDMLIFKSAFNDMYVRDISNKLRSSLYTKKKKGLFVGCYAPYGYQKNLEDGHQLEIDFEASVVVRRIFDMFIRGNSVSQICDILTKECVPTPSMRKNMKLGQGNIHYGVWSSRTVDSILKNPTYIGNLTQCRNRKVSYKSRKRVHTQSCEWVVAEGAVEAIVDREVFDLAQKMFLSNKNRGSRGNGITNKLLLRGLVFCMDCGHTIGFRAVMQRTKKWGEVCRVYGNCNYWVKRKHLGVCSPHSVSYQVIEDLVLNHLRGILCKYFDDDKLRNMVRFFDGFRWKKDAILKEIGKINSYISCITKKIDICYGDKLDGNITLEMYQRLYENMLLEIDRYSCRKSKCEEMLRELEVDYDKEYYLSKVRDFFLLKSPSISFISSLIDGVEVDEGKNLSIYYKFRSI